MYCDKIKETITKQKKYKTNLIEELQIITSEQNYPQRKNLETQIKLIESQIKQNENILNVLLLECPRESCDFEIICEAKCKWYYENIIKK